MTVFDCVNERSPLNPGGDASEPFDKWFCVVYFSECLAQAENVFAHHFVLLVFCEAAGVAGCVC